MKTGKKILSFISSMNFGILLMLLTLAACIAGSLIPQGESVSYYSDYSALLRFLILKLGLDDVFHVWWFIILEAALCMNLFFCNLLHFPQIIRKMNSYTPESTSGWHESPTFTTAGDPGKLFEAMGFKKVHRFRNNDSAEALYAVRNRCGVWGSWLTHLGILIIIIGFTLGQIYTVKYTVYGVPGQTKPVEGTSYELTINSFSVPLREDETVVQYISDLTMTDTLTGSSQSGEASVNHPVTLFGMKVYQNSTGWAADVNVSVDGEHTQTEVVCAGEYTTIEAVEGLYIVFRAFYPDMATDSSGHPYTVSSSLNNPACLYMIYYGDRLVGMNVIGIGEEITVNNITITFDDPRQYSLLQLKHDPFTWIALIGGVCIMLALVLAFYMRTEELYACQSTGGEWLLYPRSRKGGLLFLEKLEERAADSGIILTPYKQEENNAAASEN